MNDDKIREELERLRLQKEKELHYDLNARLRRESFEENWDLAESVFTQEELADHYGQRRRLTLTLWIAFATFWLSILFLSVLPTDTVFGDSYPGFEVLLIGLLFVSFFGWWVFLFQRGANRQDFTREFARRLEARKTAGRKTVTAEEETP